MTVDPLPRPPARQSDAHEFFAVLWRLVVVGLVILSPVLLVRGCAALVAGAYRTPPGPETCLPAGSGSVCARTVTHGGDPALSSLKVRVTGLSAATDLRLTWTYDNPAYVADLATIRLAADGRLEGELNTNSRTVQAVTFTGQDAGGSAFTVTVPVARQQ